MEQIRALLYDAAIILWRRRWLSLAAAWLISALGWAAVMLIPNQYEASARLYVDSDAVLTPLLKGLALDDTPAAQLDTLQRTLLSRPNLEKLVSKTDLELSIRSPADLERLTQQLADKIKVTPATHNLFTISYRNASAKLAYNVVQTVLSIFIESKAGTSRIDMANARQFLEQQITSYEQQLRRAEARRADFRARYVDLLPSDANGGQTRLEQARAALSQLEGQLTDEQRRLSLLQQELVGIPAQLSADTPEGAALVGGAGFDPRLAQAETDLAALRLKYTDTHPEVIKAQNLVDVLRRQGPRSVAGTAPSRRSFALANPLYAQVKAQIVDSEARVTSLERQVGDEAKERDRMETIARGAPGLQAEYTDLERGYDVLRKNYEELLARREAMRLASAADTEGSKVKTQVVDPPTVPQLPVSPNRPLLLVGVLVAGLGAGLGLPIGLQQFDSSIQSVEQLREFELPVLGGVTLIALGMPVRRRLMDVAGLGIIGFALLVVFAGLLMRTLRVFA